MERAADNTLTEEQSSRIYSGIKSLQEGAGFDEALSKYDRYRITLEKQIEQPEPSITIAGAAIASPGNITAISAAAKAGKTAVTGVIAAGAISPNGIIDGFADLQVISNPNGRAVISFDTEQSEADQQYKVNTVCKRAGIESTPDYYREYNIRQLTTAEYQQVTDDICEACNRKFGGIHVIIIDGGADYILSVNDEEAASRIVQYFTHLAIKYKCPVIVVVHQNPGSDKERGHFGSEIQRKCYGLLTITKEGDISTLAPKIMRKAGNGDVPLIHFTYSKERGYHVPIDGVDSDKKAVQKDREKHRAVSALIFKPLVALNYKESISAIMKETSRAERTAKSMLTNMIGWNYVEKGVDGIYRQGIDQCNSATQCNLVQTAPVQ